MANDWFKFKEFKVDQGKCGMKVSTDACIQGALAANFLRLNPSLKTSLDIGTGTGLLSLMLAQKNPQLKIDAIEMDKDAFQQATQNFMNSPWPRQIFAYHYDFLEWSNEKLQTLKVPYDFIICNPPFFQNHLQSKELQRNTARHSISLNQSDLLKNAAQLISNYGVFCVLFPQNGWMDFEALATTNGFCLIKLYKIKPKPEIANNRLVAFFGKNPRWVREEKELVIYKREAKYTADFQLLLKDYYLYL